MLYTTHYMEEAERLCTRIVIVDQGQMMAEGARRELVATLGEQDLVRLDVAGDAVAAAAACAEVDGVQPADIAAAAASRVGPPVL